LVALREAHGYSQAVLARLAGISQTLLWKLERRNHTPKGLKTALALADVFRVPITDIWPGAAPATTSPQHRPSAGVKRRRLPSRNSAKNQGKSKG
jgi:DNA-binding XRE family transcriptional regulator